MRAYEKRHQIKDAAAVKSWLFQIAYRCFLDERKKTARRENLARLAPDETAPDIEAAPHPLLSLDLERAMNSLGQERRAVVILCLAYGLSHGEAARITGLPLGTIKSHCNRGKAKLRAFLSAYETAN